MGVDKEGCFRDPVRKKPKKRSKGKERKKKKVNRSIVSDHRFE